MDSTTQFDRITHWLEIIYLATRQEYQFTNANGMELVIFYEAQDKLPLFWVNFNPNEEIQWFYFIFISISRVAFVWLRFSLIRHTHTKYEHLIEDLK